ncbi:hypothetical protein HKD37_04G010744 [Glycine soja]
MLLCCIPCFLLINVRFIRGCTRTISTNPWFFLLYQLNIFPFNFCFVNYSYFRSRVASGGSNPAHLGELCGNLLPFFPINRRKGVVLRIPDPPSYAFQLFWVKKLIMASPPVSPPPPPPTPSDASASPPPGAERPVVHVDPATSKADGPHRKKLRTYLGIVARDRVDVTYENWKEAESEIPEASNSRMKRKLLQIVGKRWRQFKPDLTRKWALAGDQDGVEDTVCEKYGISKEKWAQFCQTRRDPSWEDVCKKAQAIQKQNIAPHVLSRGDEEEAGGSCTGSVDGVIDPPSPVRRHVKWKMVCTKKTGEMTTEAAKEITEKIVSHFQLTIRIIFQYFVNAMYNYVFSMQDSFEEQATQGSFVSHGRQDVLTAAIGRPEHPGCVRAAGASVTIKQYFGSAPRTSCSSSSLPPEELDQLEESITEKVTRQLMASFSQMQSQMQSQGLALPPEPLVGPSNPRVSTKGSCVDPSINDPEMGDSDRCGLYIEVDPARLVALGRVYEGSTVVHNTPLLPGQVKVSVEEVTDVDSPVPVPTDEGKHFTPSLLDRHIWSIVSPAKPPPKPDPQVDDPLYLMTLTIPELFLRSYQVTWDATVFGVFSSDFPLYIKHEDLSEIAHGGISLKQLCKRGIMISIDSSSHSPFRGLGNRSLSLKTWIQSSKRDVYLGAYLNGGHWQMVVILPKEHLVVWFCSLHSRPDNYLKGIINSALKGLDDAPQPKSKAPTRWIVIKYFNDPRPLELERLKALQI